jgi:hypothetical protein
VVSSENGHVDSFGRARRSLAGRVRGPDPARPYLTQKGRQDGNPAALVLMDGTMDRQITPAPARRQRSALNPDRKFQLRLATPDEATRAWRDGNQVDERHFFYTAWAPGDIAPCRLTFSACHCLVDQIAGGGEAFAEQVFRHCVAVELEKKKRGRQGAKAPSPLAPRPVVAALGRFPGRLCRENTG